MSDLRTPLSRVKGLGSAKEGVGHWWHQRLTALLILPLLLVLIFGTAMLPHADFISFTRWVASPSVTVILLIAIAAIFYHAQLGLQVLIEDYVSSHMYRTVAILFTGFICLLSAVVGVVSVLKIALGA